MTRVRGPINQAENQLSEHLKCWLTSVLLVLSVCDTTLGLVDPVDSFKDIGCVKEKDHYNWLFSMFNIHVMLNVVFLN